LRDIPSWLRSLRLHKYAPVLSACSWLELISFTDDDLKRKGVMASGARRKMLKCFDLV
ncbi:hypothetical protein CXG81DRAFT_7980, partial [Caulochytrium protostelioides]